MGASIHAVNAIKGAASNRDRSNVTRQIGRDETRAYVHVRDAHLTWGGPNAEYPNITLTVENTGQTPAKWFEIRKIAFIKALDPDGGSTEALSFRRAEVARLEATRWPSIAKIKTCEALTTAQGQTLRSAYQQNKAIVIMGVVRYETFFNEVFETEFCFFSKRTPSYRFETVSVDSVDEGLATRVTNFTQETPNKMSSTPMNLRAYEKICEHN